MPNLISVETALDIILNNTTPMPVETVPMLEALGRPVAADLTSDIDINAFDDAAMDGYAIRAADTVGASADAPAQLRVVDVVGAGSVYAGVLQPGEAVRIMTGAAMPAGADANVMVEKVEFTGDGGAGETLRVFEPAESGLNVRRAGDEAKAGEVVLASGTVLNAAGMGLLAATGNVEVPVRRRPVVGVLSVGSELIDSTTVPEMGKKRDSNKYTLAAMATEAGATPRIYGTVADDPEAIRSAYLEAIGECDVVVSSGGACGGDFDYISQIIAEVGEVKFEYVNMRPGKAQTFGVASDGTLLFGLSGNPAASATGFEMLVRPAILKSLGFEDVARPVVRARLVGGRKKVEKRRFYMRAILTREKDGSYVVEPLKKQSSQLIGATSRCNCFAVVPEGGVQVVDGMEVECVLLR